MNVIGIDPGKSGGIAVVDDCAGAVAFKLDTTERDVWDTLLECRDNLNASVAFIEKVNAFPKQGVSSTFKFGKSYGMLIGMLVALKVRFEYVPPGVWQRNLSCLSKGDKNVTKAKAQELFPSLKITHAIADALLIAEYGRRKEMGHQGSQDQKSGVGEK